MFVLTEALGLQMLPDTNHGFNALCTSLLLTPPLTARHDAKATNVSVNALLDGASLQRWVYALPS